mmetsp:Transcript_108/g.364  ORF Transcript_108/g.364 Transcript_108/m.364 type:complete len:92 (-) Transcript_108:252-527(-)
MQRHKISERVRGHRLRLFSWLPVCHDMGLIGFLCTPIFFGCEIFQMSPLDFIRKPYLWLQGACLPESRADRRMVLECMPFGVCVSFAFMQA